VEQPPVASAAGRPLGPHGHQQLAGGEHAEQPRRPLGGRGDDQQPQQLHDGDPDGVAQAAGPQLGEVVGDAEPLRDERHAHDHVADDAPREHVVLDVARDGGGVDEHAGDLQQRQQAVRHVVGVVGRGEPGEVHPRPPHPEEGHQEPHDPVADVPGDELVVQPTRRLGDGDDEAQVDEQLQRRGPPVFLVGIADDGPDADSGPARSHAARLASRHRAGQADDCRFRRCRPRRPPRRRRRSGSGRARRRRGWWPSCSSRRRTRGRGRGRRRRRTRRRRGGRSSRGRRTS
jgi:hypothetical protein